MHRSLPVILLMSFLIILPAFAHRERDEFDAKWEAQIARSKELSEALQKKNITKVIQMRTEEIVLAQKGFGQASLQLAHAYDTLGRDLVSCGDISGAKQYKAKADAVMQLVSQRKLQETKAREMRRSGLMSLKQAKTKQAVQILQRAAVIAEQAGPQSQEFQLSLYDLAFAQQNAGEFSNAALNYNRLYELVTSPDYKSPESVNYLFALNRSSTSSRGLSTFSMEEMIPIWMQSLRRSGKSVQADAFMKKREAKVIGRKAPYQMTFFDKDGHAVKGADKIRVSSSLVGVTWDGTGKIVGHKYSAIPSAVSFASAEIERIDSFKDDDNRVAEYVK
jgi:hypothetical protein